MNILITGNLSSIAGALSKEFAKEKNRVVLASYNISQDDQKSDNLVYHSINPAENIFRDALSAYKFEIVIFLATREEQIPDMGEYLYASRQLSSLLNALDLCKNNKVKRFVFVSSTEIYGEGLDSSEAITPSPATINGETLSACENYCRIYQRDYGMNITILRLPNIYGLEEKTGLLYRLVQGGKNQKEVKFPDSQDTICNFIHSDDVVNFIRRMLDEEYSIDSMVINLASSKPMTYFDLGEMFKSHFSKVSYVNSGKREIYTRSVIVSKAKKQFDWIDSHLIADDFDEIIKQHNSDKETIVSSYKKILGRLESFSSLLKWIELFLGAGLAQYLTQITGTLFQFKYVDFRLLFVVIMGSIYGIRFGLLAFGFVSVSLLYTWYAMGFDWALLIYNVGNWFPFALYFGAGLITGYNHDKTENQIENEQKQSNLMYEKYSFLYGVFNDIRSLKDEFREQLIGYRDSFGKIFTITRELDQLQEQAVYSRALSILEDLMGNNSIAIYSLDSNRIFSRLEVHSTSLIDKIARSLNLSEYPEVQEAIDRGEIFQNTLLLPKYPAYVAPIINNSYPFNVPVAIIVIWNVKFEQYSTYYYNLFKVISDLVQASLVRAALFLDANYEKIYLPSTKILNYSSFKDALKIRVEMKRNKIADCQLILVDRAENHYRDIYSKISKGIRSADLIGLWKDDNYYILLSQANEMTSEEVLTRLLNLGVKGRLMEINKFSID